MTFLFSRRALLGLLAVTVTALAATVDARAAVPAPPGGPILVVTPTSNANATYYPEILRAEGLNEFAVAGVGQLSGQVLNAYDTVILAAPVTATQVSTLSAWVQGGGNLVAMRPDPKLAPLLGLTGGTTTLSNGYVKVDTSGAPGKGIVATPIQYHGDADRYALANGARAVATLYSDATTATTNPAVSLRAVGNGHAAAFTYDLAQSIVATRQGNIGWTGQDRDADHLVRANDMFFGGTVPDWVNLNQVAIPQADEQQRLLANLVVQDSPSPLPRFWYFPRGDKAELVLTGDAHGSSDFTSIFDSLRALDPASGCDLSLWQCVRATAYVYPTKTNGEPVNVTDQAIANYQTFGFEIALHPHLDPNGSCNVGFTPSSLNTIVTQQLAAFHSRWPSAAAPTTIRTHCIAWSDWDSQPNVDLAHGIRLNTDYYYLPGSWTHDRAGMFTGSGIPMRLTNRDGSLVDVYQATTYAADDATEGAPATAVPAMVNSLLQNAVNANGYYGAFTVIVHDDSRTASLPTIQAVVQAAKSRGLSVISERQLLTWLDGRNSSAFSNISFGADGTLRFTVTPGSGATGLQALLPVHDARGGTLSALTHAGAPVDISHPTTIKGVDYIALPNASGAYQAKYPPPPARPVLPADPAPDGSTGVAPTTGTTTPATKQASVKRASRTVKWVTASGGNFRPGGKRRYVVTVRLSRAAKLVLTFRDSHGKRVRVMRTGRHSAGAVVRLRWSGKDSRGRYVKAGKYRFTLSAISSGGATRGAHGTLKVLKAR